MAPPKKVAPKVPAKPQIATLKELHARLSPKDIGAYNKLFQMIDNRRFGEMISLCDQILKVAPGHMEVLAFKGFAVFYLAEKEYGCVKGFIPEPDEFKCRAAGQGLLEEATNACKGQSHIPYQLRATVLKQLKDFKTAEQMYREIVALPNWQGSYTFNRDLAIMLLFQGEYKPALDFFKKALPAADKDSREYAEANLFLAGMLASKKTPAIDAAEVDAYIQKQIKQRERECHMADVQNKHDMAHNTRLAELNQLVLYQSAFQRLLLGPSERLANLTALLTNPHLLDREQVYRLIVDAVIEGKLADKAEELIDAARNLTARNANDQELVVRAGEFLLNECGWTSEKVLALSLELAASAMPIVKAQLTYHYTRSNVAELIQVYSKLRASGALQMLLSFAPEITREQLLQHATGLLLQAAVLKFDGKYPDDASSFALTKFIAQKTPLKLVPAMDQFEEALEEYERKRIEENSKRKSEDEKVTVPLPPVPALTEASLQAALDAQRGELIQQALMVSLYGPESDKTEASRLVMMMDVRDRFLNVVYARRLAQTGDFRKALHVYQKFVARNDAQLYLVDNQELQVALEMALFEPGQGKAAVPILEGETATEENFLYTVRVPQTAMLCEILKSFEDQRWDTQDLFYQQSRLFQKPIYAQCLKTYAKNLIQRPLVQECLSKLRALLQEFAKADPAKLEEYRQKYAAFYKKQFKEHCKFDGEYQRASEEDFYEFNLIAKAAQGQIELPARIASFVKRAEELGVKFQ